MRNAIRSYDFLKDAPAGYHVALRVGFAFPMAEDNTFPAAWIEEFTRCGYLLHDPVLRWAYGHTGAIRWSDIDAPDPMAVLSRAASHGMKYGVVISCVDDGPSGQRSFGSFARPDREFTLAETGALAARLQELHDHIVPPKNLTCAELEALRMVKDGMLLKEIATEIGVTEGAVKQRLKSAKVKLKAKTSAQATTLATEFGLI